MEIDGLLAPRKPRSLGGVGRVLEQRLSTDTVKREALGLTAIAGEQLEYERAERPECAARAKIVTIVTLVSDRGKAERRESSSSRQLGFASCSIIERRSVDTPREPQAA